MEIFLNSYLFSRKFSWSYFIARCRKSFFFPATKMSKRGKKDISFTNPWISEATNTFRAFWVSHLVCETFCQRLRIDSRVQSAVQSRYGVKSWNFWVRRPIATWIPKSQWKSEGLLPRFMAVIGDNAPDALFHVYEICFTISRTFFKTTHNFTTCTFAWAGSLYKTHAEKFRFKYVDFWQGHIQANGNLSFFVRFMWFYSFFPLFGNSSVAPVTRFSTRHRFQRPLFISEK